MSEWTKILNADEIAAYHAQTAKLDLRFARGEREWYSSRTAAQLQTEISRSWNGNQSTPYMLARSYLALKEAGV